MDIWITTVLLVVTFFLLATETIPIDLTALGIIVVLLATGILSPGEAVSGFANPAVITVGSMFVISRALMRTGALGFVGERIIAHSKGNARRIMLLSLVIVAVSSAFINNTPVVVLSISILMTVCCQYGLSPSRFMIPASFASILAGSCTLIGTSTNIIVSDLSHAGGYGPIAMFELATLGAPIALVGILYLYFASPHIMPDHMAPICELRDSEDRKYLAELLVPESSKLIGQDLSVLPGRFPSMELFEIIREPVIHFPRGQHINLQPGDLVFVKASANDLIAVLNDKLLELPFGEKELDFKIHGGSLIVELIIPPQSHVLGSRLMGSSLQIDPDVRIIAVKRRRTHYAKQKLRELRLSVGDILLVHCPRDHLDQIRAGNDFIVVEDIHHQIIHKRKAPVALAIFVGMVVSATTGLAGIMVCAVSAVFLMLLGGCLQMRDAYRSIDVRVLLLLVGTIALGTAMQKTGTAELYAKGFLGLFQGQSPHFILSAFILLTSLSTHLLSNNATAVLLLPIGISTALSLGVDPKPFIIGICYGANACYATPIGYQTNLLVYGPGGYRFSDYIKLGIPLTFLVWSVSSLFIPTVWSF